MSADLAEGLWVDGYLRVFQMTISSLIVGIWALTAAVYPNQLLAIVLTLLSVLLLSYATLVYVSSTAE